MTTPQVLGLDIEEARSRLSHAGIPVIDVKISGRRRVGNVRVIRQRQTPGGVELIASFFRQLGDKPQ
jgi:beta-lactam-binding protein with PASTA domain